MQLVDARRAQGWSQQEVAERIGTTHVNISRWERGLTCPGPYYRCKLCSLYTKSEQELDLTRFPTVPVAEVPSAQVQVPLLCDPALPQVPELLLFGREQEMSRVVQQLCTGNMITAVHGLPGVGKTVLAARVASDPAVRAFFRDGILWASLGSDPDIPALLRRWGRLLGVPASIPEQMGTVKSWTFALRSVIAGRRMLIILDDVWRSADALYCFVGGSRCSYLVLSRSTLVSVATIQTGAEHPIQLSELDEVESLELLRLQAPALLKKLTAAQVQRFLRISGGVPLAIMLFAEYLLKRHKRGSSSSFRVAWYSLVNQAECRMHIQSLRGTRASSSSIPSGSAFTLLSVFSASLVLLDPPVLQVLAALAQLPPWPQTFSEERALEVACCSPEALDALSDAGLLENAREGCEYTLNPLVVDWVLVVSAQHMQRGVHASTPVSVADRVSGSEH